MKRLGFELVFLERLAWHLVLRTDWPPLPLDSFPLCSFFCHPLGFHWSSNEVSAPSSEPLASLSKQRQGRRPKAVPLKDVGSVDYRDEQMEPLAALEISDDSDDCSDGKGKTVAVAKNVAGPNWPTALRQERKQGQHLSLNGVNVHDLVIFRVPHKHPHMLKRPLQHVDGLSFMDMAVRMYEVSQVPANQDENAPCHLFQVRSGHLVHVVGAQWPCQLPNMISMYWRRSPEG